MTHINLRLAIQRYGQSYHLWQRSHRHRNPALFDLLELVEPWTSLSLHSHGSISRAPVDMMVRTSVKLKIFRHESVSSDGRTFLSDAPCCQQSIVI